MRLPFGIILVFSIITTAAWSQTPVDFESKVQASNGNFNALLSSMGESFPSASWNYIKVRVPFSRSRHGNLSSLKNPRVIVSLINSTRDEPNSFLGYVRGTNEIELIEWNRQEEKYEFKLVRNYGPGKKTVIEKVNQQTCLGCHQSGGPIFSADPWAETDAGREVARALGVKKFSDHVGYNFDGAVGISNLQVRNKKICQALCAHEDLACRTKLLTLALRGDFVDDGWKKSDTEILAWIQNAIGDQDFAYSSDKIPDRKPILRKGQPLNFAPAKLGDSRHPMTVRPKHRGLSAQEIQAQLPRLAIDCFRVSENTVNQSRNMKKAGLNALLTRPECVQKIWSHFTLDDEKLLEVLNGNCEHSQNVAVAEIAGQCEVKTEPNPGQLTQLTQKLLPKLLLAPMSVSEKKSASSLLLKSCMSCHGAGKNMDLGLDWKNLDAVRAYKGAHGSRVVDKILSGEMPPNSKLSDDEKNLLIRALSPR